MAEAGLPADTVAQALRAAAALLEATSPTARLDAEVLMAHALGASRSDLLLRHQRSAVPEGFAELVERRLAHEPVAYITGVQEFFGRDFAVSPAVLIPRGDSETIVEAALDALPPMSLASTDALPLRVLDCGTGSGALLLTVLAERGDTRGVGVDCSPAALAVAQANGEALGMGERVEWLERNWHDADWRDGVGRFALVLSNPPYVETTVTLDPDVAQWEPHGALFAGAEGLDDYRVLIPQLEQLLVPGGVAVLEIGYAQADSVTAIAKGCGFHVELRRDLAGRPRALVLRFALGK